MAWRRRITAGEQLRPTFGTPQAGESVRAALEAIAVAAPDWLPTVIDIAD